MKAPFSLILCALGFCASAAAQRYEFGLLGGYPRISHVPLGSDSAEDNKDSDTKLRGKYSYGAVITLNTKGYYGFELGYLMSRATLTSTFRTTPEGGTQETVTRQSAIPIHMPFGNFLIYFMPRNERWRPFFTAGGQVYQYGNPHFPEWDRGSSRNYGFNWGGGIKLRLFSHALVRLDARDYYGGKPYDLLFESDTATSTSATSLGGHGSLHTLVGTVGLSITF